MMKYENVDTVIIIPKSRLSLEMASYIPNTHIQHAVWNSFYVLSVDRLDSTANDFASLVSGTTTQLVQEHSATLQHN